MTEHAPRRAIYSGSPFEAMAGYSRAVVDGEWVFVSGTAGYDPATAGFPEGATAQARVALATIAAALGQAGGTLADVVRMRVYLAERADVAGVSAILGEMFGDPRPTNTTILCGFPDARIKVEIEATARLATG